mmetsp:Transcript_19174/g.62954  ORF Transcript_19174/g.62954 Transcript_19174/m.62954 type:complete len:121 (-) Transcript_19174:93-455(-)
MLVFFIPLGGGVLPMCIIISACLREHIVDYDHDDLDSSKMFLLSTGDSYFLWVGLCFIDTNSRATRSGCPTQADTHRQNFRSHVYAHDLLALLLKQGSSGNVIWENDETDGFWKAFELGF